MTLADRIFAQVGSDTDADTRHKASSARRLFVCAAAVHGWVLFSRNDVDALRSLHLVAAVILTGAAIGSFSLLTQRRAAVLAFCTCLARLLATFPHAYNHLFLEAVVFAAAAGLQADDDAENRLLLQFARWLAVIVLFWSGVQKVLHGCYGSGQFLALMVATNEHFAAPFATFFPHEVERLRQLLPLRYGAGPFAFEPMALIAASNLVWLSEIGLGLALLQSSLRPIAAFIALLLLVTIQVVAHELVFGFWLAMLLALYAPARWFSLLEPVGLLALASILTIAIGWPSFWMN